MGIDLTGAVVVVDEAHNVEDAAREAASVSVTEADLADAIGGLDALIGPVDSFRFLCLFTKTYKKTCTKPHAESETEPERRDVCRQLKRLAGDFLAWTQTADAGGATAAKAFDTSERVSVCRCVWVGV
jgi:Rad3-related DNA helicase